MPNLNIDPLLEAFLYESNSLLEKAELILVECEAKQRFDEEDINEIFRVMHTIKGSSAMMEYGMLAKTAHKVEDLFYFIRDQNPQLDFLLLSDIVLAVLDAMKAEIEQIEAGEEAAMEASDSIVAIEEYLVQLKDGKDASLDIDGELDPVVNGMGGDAFLPTPEEISTSSTPMTAVDKKESKDLPTDVNANAESTEYKTLEAEQATVKPLASNSSQKESQIRCIPNNAVDSLANDAFDYDFQVWMNFDQDCQMENLRAFTAVTRLQEVARVLSHEPADLDAEATATPFVNEKGFTAWIDTSMTPEELLQYLETNVLYIKNIEIYEALERPLEAVTTENILTTKEMTELVDAQEHLAVAGGANELTAAERDLMTPEQGEELLQTGAIANKQTSSDQKVAGTRSLAKQNFISVNVNKLDTLMDIVGELVISEMMVINHPELVKMADELDGFEKAANQLKKITSELQDIVMSIRMVPIGGTFQSMRRIVRDMSRKLNKQVTLIISGEETEVDKNVIDSISDPLMHLIRNSLDHGLESAEERLAAGKPEAGTIFLEARTEGGDVWLTVRDDGKGMVRENIIEKAQNSGLLSGDGAELSDREVWGFVLKPGFSTKDNVTEFSGRGVGMDVVTKNLEKIGGKLSIESKLGEGTAFQIKIPLTLAIIDGMEITVSDKRYTIPITLIREAFRVENEKVVIDGEGNELIMIRGISHEVIRLHRTFAIKDAITDLSEGILLVVEHESRSVCIFADQLVGEHQVVVKPVPIYLGQIEGVTGCTILGDGTISLILDVNGLVERKRTEGGSE